MLPYSLIGFKCRVKHRTLCCFVFIVAITVGSYKFMQLKSLANRVFVHEIEYISLSSFNLCHGSQTNERALLKESLIENSNDATTSTIITIRTML